jgi:putative transposase
MSPFPYVFVDATYVKARVDHQVVSRAVVIATGVTAEGGREVLGVDVGDSEDAVFWTAFLTSLKDRGLGGVDLVISDAHRGLQAAIRKTMQGSAWQRCKVHLVRNILSHVPRGQAEMVAAFVRTIFAQPDADAARRQLREVATRLERSLPKAAGVLADAEDDVTAYAVFPRHHWRKIWSTNPLERVNKEIKRRTNVVGVFPNDDAVLRLVGAILAEQHDEWQTSDRRYLTMNNATVLDLEQPITLELEAA